MSKLRRAPYRKAGVSSGWLAATILTLSMAAQAAPFTITDDRGVRVTFEELPSRIVTLLPSLTETVWELGARERVVGTDLFSNWPQAVKDLPKLGGLEGAQVERLYALKPDVVLAAKSARVLDRLEALGLKVLALESQSLSDTRRTVGVVAQVLGRPEAGAELLARIDTRTRHAAARIPAGWRGARVYFEVSSTPYAASESSFIGELGDGFSWKSRDLEHSAQLARDGWARAAATISAGEHFLVALDEITYPPRYGWLPLNGVLQVLRDRPPHVHVVLTGRRAPQELVDLADTVTEMTMVKHHFKAGVPAQRGIED